jgi:SAM-dependent methyltransferase
MELDYLKHNKESWNKRTAVHIASEFYNNEAFIQGKSSLNEIELGIIGDVSGLSILHLQCHFGQDTISLSRLGAQTTGVDLSDAAIAKAKELAALTQTNAQFICCDVYSLPEHLNQQFDIVYSTYGTIGWLPDLDQWAKIVQHFLKPGGRLILVEFHPVVWMFDNDFTHVKYNYFNVAPIVEPLNGTYAAKDAELGGQDITWNHPLSEVFSSLLNNGMAIESFDEFNYSPYDCFSHTMKVAKGFQIKQMEDKIPMVYALVAKNLK